MKKPGPERVSGPGCCFRMFPWAMRDRLVHGRHQDHPGGGGDGGGCCCSLGGVLNRLAVRLERERHLHG